jgi:chromate reductase
MRLLGLCGSTRTGSYNRALLAAAAEMAPAGATIEPYDLRRLPMYDDDVRLAGFPGEVVAFREAVRAADGLVFATPEYNRSIPTILKNAIDWASRAPDQPFNGKPAAVMTAATGLLGGALANHHLRQVLVYLNVFVLPGPEVMVAQAAQRFDAEGRLTHQPTREAVTKHLASFVAFARR